MRLSALRTWAPWRRACAAAFLGLLILGSIAWFPWFRGSASSTRLLDTLVLLDPLAAIEAGLASRSIETGALVGALIVIMLAVLLGPVFCGFLCPLGLLLDLNHAARRRFRRIALGRRTVEGVPVGVPRWIKLALLGVLVGISMTARLPVFQAFSPISLLVRAIVFGSTLGLIVVGLLVVVEWFVPRVWCRALCPLGAFYTLVGRAGMLRVRIDQSGGTLRGCQRCDGVCPMGIPVMQNYSLNGSRSVTHPDCIRCGDCTDVCPRGMLSLRFRNRRPSRGSPESDGSHHLPVLSCGTERQEETAHRVGAAAS